MAIFDKISFPPTDFVTGKPKVDGWTDNVDPGVAAHNPESGYAAGGRIAFGGGSLVPPVAFQSTEVQIANGADLGLPAGSLAAGNYLVLGFFCTFDPSFDEADGISVAFMPDFAAPAHTSARRIDLLPNSTAGAGPSSDVIDPIPGQATNYYARLNRDLFQVPTFYKGVGTNQNPTDIAQTRWQSIGVSNCVAKAASWHPTTMSANAVAGQQVPSGSASFSLTATVDISNFPDAGNLTVALVGGEVITVTYTGVDGVNNKFTGCKARPTHPAPVSVDAAVPMRLQDVGWSVEVVVPETAALGGAEWIELEGHFGLYANLFRVSEYVPTPPGTPHAGALAAQFRFPLPEPTATDQQYLTGFLDETLYIGESWYGRATISRVVGTNDVQGVCFQNVADPASSVGVRHPGSPNPTELTQFIYGATGAFDNTLVAQIQNTNPTSAANAVSAEFRFGKWGNPPTAYAQWEAASAHGASAPNTVDLPAAGGSKEITSTWLRSDVGKVYQGDICLWVRLDSTNTVEFAQDGVRRNIIFTNLSEESRDATISGRGYPAPASGSHHNFLLVQHVRSVEVPHHVIEGGEQVPVVWFWIVETLRRTGLELTVRGRKTEVVDPAPGQFGALARHDGQPGDVFATQLSGGGLTHHGNFDEIRVPHDGEVTIGVWMGAGPAGTLRPPSGPGAGGLPVWLRWLLNLLRRLIAWIKKLFK